MSCDVATYPLIPCGNLLRMVDHQDVFRPVGTLLQAEPQFLLQRLNERRPGPIVSGSGGWT